MAVEYKYRRWQAFLSISASGPEFAPVFEEAGRVLRPRMAADLRYTTADADFLENFYREPNYDSGNFELHNRLRNPTTADVLAALQAVLEWFRSHRDNVRSGMVVACSSFSPAMDQNPTVASFLPTENSRRIY